MDTLTNLLSSLGNRPDGVSDEAVITDLLQKNMINGLQRDPNGRLTFGTPSGGGVEPGSSGAAGYAGPLRPSDVPDWKATADIPVIYGGRQGMHISQGTEMGRMQAGGPFRGVLPDAQAQQLAQGLESSAGLPPGTNTQIAKGLMEKLGLTEDSFTKAYNHQRGINAAGGGPLNTKLATPLGNNATKYINMETGERATPDMTFGDVTGKGTKFVGMDTNQGKQYEALLNLRAHILAVAPYMKDLASSTGITGRAGNAASMQLGAFFNDPGKVELVKQLEAMTPIATARTFLGSGGRAGPAAAKMLRESNVTGGDDQTSGWTKIANLVKVANELAKDNGLSPAMFKNLAAEAGIPEEIQKKVLGSVQSGAASGGAPKIIGIKRLN